MKLVPFPGPGTQDADAVLAQAADKHNDVIVIGLDYQDDTSVMSVYSSGDLDCTAVNWYLDQIKTLLLTGEL